MNKQLTTQGPYGQLPSGEITPVDSNQAVLTDIGSEETTETGLIQDKSEDLSAVADMVLLRKMAEEENNVDAQFQLGYNYHEGCYVKQDYKEALAWYHKAAACGHPVAQYNLSLLYINGYGMKKADKRKAFYYAHSAAVGGYPMGQVNTGYYYLNGQGVRQNIKNALLWSVEGAENGEETAAENVAVIQENFKLTESGDLDKKQYRRGLFPSLFLIIGIVLSLWMVSECIRGFSYGMHLYGAHHSLLILPSLAIAASGVMLFLRQKKGCYVLLAGLIFYLVYLFAGGYHVYVMMFALPVILGVMIPGRDGQSIYATTIQNTEIGRFFEQVGYGPEYEPNTTADKRYKGVAFGSVVLLAVLLGIVIVPLFKNWEGFSLPGNVFKSPWLPFLMFIGFFLGLKDKVSSYKTYDVYENKYTGEKRYEESGDIIDSMSGSILAPLLQRFILIPLVYGVLIYYALYLIVKLLSGILPYVIVLAAIALLAGLVVLYMRNSSKKYRFALIAALNLVLVSMICGLWLI